MYLLLPWTFLALEFNFLDTWIQLHHWCSRVSSLLAADCGSSPIWSCETSSFFIDKEISLIRHVSLEAGVHDISYYLLKRVCPVWRPFKKLYVWITCIKYVQKKREHDKPLNQITQRSNSCSHVSFNHSPIHYYCYMYFYR